MSLLYYSRMKFTLSLLPLLLASPLPAHVISVFGPGRDTTFIPTDLSLRDPKNYSFLLAGCHAAYLTTFFMEHLAAKNPGRLALVHYYPGLVTDHAAFRPNFPWWGRVMLKLGKPLLHLIPVYVKGQHSGERVVFNASSKFPARPVDSESAPLKTKDGLDVAFSSDGVLGGGAYRVNFNGELIPTGKQYPKIREEGWLDKVVQHTLTAFEEIKAGKVFAG